MEQVITFDTTTAAIAELKEKYPVVGRIEDKKQLKEVKEAVADIRGRRTAVETRRKNLKADALEYGRKVDAKAKELTELLLEIEDPLKEAVKEFENRERLEREAAERAERERVEAINELFRVFDNPLHPMSTQDEVQAFIDKVSSVDMDKVAWQERFDEAVMKQRFVIQQAQAQLVQRKQFDEAQEILKSQREQMAQREVQTGVQVSQPSWSVQQESLQHSEQFVGSPNNVRPFAQAVQKKMSDEEIASDALNQARIILSGAAAQLSNQDLKQKLGVFVDMLEKTQESVLASA